MFLPWLFLQLEGVVLVLGIFLDVLQNKRGELGLEKFLPFLFAPQQVLAEGVLLWGNIKLT